MAKYKTKLGINENVHTELLDAKAFHCSQNSSLEKLNSSRWEISMYWFSASCQKKGKVYHVHIHSELHQKNSGAWCTHLQFTINFLVTLNYEQPGITRHLRKSSSVKMHTKFNIRDAKEGDKPEFFLSCN